MTSQGVVTLDEIVQVVGDDLARVEDFFEEQVRSDVPLIAQVGRYLREGGGKRIRPALVLLSASVCGYRGDRAVPLAAVVEFLHAASLLHDDVVDEADRRRGRASVNRRWGNDLAVLLGDFLYAKSIAMALSQDELRILGLLSEATLRMVEGQLLEIQHCADLQVTPADHIDIIRRKTASLFAASMRIGAILGDAGEARARALASYGTNLGICFQMADDLLDLTADEQRLGKPVASDLREGKLTLPVIFALRRAGPVGVEKVRAVLEDRGFGRVPAHEIARLAWSCGAIDEARALAARHAEAARRDLLTCERSPWLEALWSLPELLLARNC